LSFAQEHIELFSMIPLQSLLPAGMIDGESSPGGENAARAFTIIESLILESTSRNALLSRHALLQTFPRVTADSDASTESLHAEPGAGPDLCRRYAESLVPSWYVPFLDSLDELETELFLKAYLLGHETWGHADGIALLCRLAAEHATGTPVTVAVDRLPGEERRIPEHLQSRMGSGDAYSTIGRDFVLGSRFRGRPEYYHIRIGPISVRMLERLQGRGWAEGTQASRKFESLIELASPFYFRAKIHIIIETVGCVIGRATLGRDRLGTVVSDREESLELAMGLG